MNKTSSDLNHSTPRSVLNRRRFLQLGAAASVASLATALAPDMAGAAAAAGDLLTPPRTLDFSGSTVVATFLAGAGPQQIGVRDLPGMPPGGPQAVCARADGSIAVLDTLNRRIAIVRGSTITSHIAITQAVFPLDLQESDGTLAVLDPAGDQILLVRNGVVSSRPLSQPRRAAVSRVALSAQPGTISLVEEDDGSAIFELESAQHAVVARGRFTDRAGRVVMITYPASLPEFRRSARVQVGGVVFAVETAGPLGSVVPLTSDRHGDIYLLVTELVNSYVGGLDVDLTVRRYRSTGTFVAMARVPVRGRWSHPRTAVAVTPTGDAIALVTERSRTSLIRLAWGSSILSLQPIRALISPSFGIATATNLIPNSRSTAISTADVFQNYWWEATSAMLDRSCGSAQRPSYIGGIGSYKEIPYCWGGWDTPSGYVSRINSPTNYFLGDVNGGSGSWKGCTAGADCSGFITRAWGITSGKQSTETLLNWVTNSPGQSQSEGGTLYEGDMWRLPNAHVRLHHQYPVGGGGDYMYEESIDWGERAWYAFRPWSEYPGDLWCLGNFAS